MATASVNLTGRNILLISTSFFGYEERIADHLRQRGARVTCLDDRPGHSALVKGLVRLKSILIRPWVNAHYARAMGRLAMERFDEILVISPDACHPSILQKLRAAFPQARLVLYMWDSFTNRRIQQVPAFLSHFDRALTFDDADATAYGIHFRPLFFTREAEPGNAAPAFAFSFVGTIHSDRYRILRALAAEADRHHLAYYIYPYLPTRFHYWLFRLLKPEFRGTRPEDFQYSPLAYAEVLRICSASLAILDMEDPGQRGLTIRSLEVFGAGRKLMTSNARVVDYPFYTPERVLVFNREAPVLEPGFFERPAPAPDPAHLRAFSIDGWTDAVFGTDSAPLAPPAAGAG
jgi:hypothetical protein